MAKYLHFDGIDDYLLTPLMTVTRVVVTLTSYHKTSTYQNYFTYGTIYFQRYTNNFDRTNIQGFSVLVDGVDRTQGVLSNNIQAIPNEKKVTFDVSNNPYNQPVTIFGNNGTSARTLKADLYEVRLFNDSDLVAHYDMSTGTVLDQSGNGNHATLVGGTWMDDGSGGGDEGTEVSEAYSAYQSVFAERIIAPSTRQELFANTERNNTVKQSIFAYRTAESSTLQTIYADRQNAHSTQQAIYRQFKTAYDMLQEIFDTSVVRVENYALEVIIHNDVSADYASQQMLHKAIETSADLKQAISRLDVLNADTRQILTRQVDERFDALQRMYADRKADYDTLIQLRDDILSLIGTIHLKAKRILDVNLKARQELFIQLRGDINMTMENQNFTLFAGDTKYIRFPVEGIPDLAGSDITWSMRKSKDTDSNVLVKRTNNGISVVDNEVQVKLDAEDTAILVGPYYHECIITDNFGNRSKVLTGYVSIK